MLKLKHLNENFELVKEILKRYWEHDTVGLDDMLGYYRISSNAIYPYRFQGEVCFLRLAPVEEKLKKNLYGEMEFIQYLAKNNYPALRPISSKSGDMCLDLHTPWGRYYVTSFRCVKGIQIAKTDKSSDIMYAYGKALGRLHTLSSAYRPNVKKWDHAEVLEWIHATLSEYEAPKCTFKEWKQIKASFDNLSIDTDNYGLIHYDFEFDNVFYDKNANFCSVIDFDDGMYNWYTMDIAQVFDCIEEELSNSMIEEAKIEFLKGYRSEHCLTEEMQASYSLMRRFTNLYGYARLIRCVADQFDVEPDWMSELRIQLKSEMHSKEAKMN